MAELFNDSSLFGSGSSSNNAPIEVIAEMLDYDFVNSCSSIDELKAILQTLKAGKFGKYPHLEGTVKDKLAMLMPEQKKKVQVVPSSSSAAAAEECEEKDSLNDWLTDGIDNRHSPVKADTTLPPVRAVTNTNLANVEVKPKVVVKKSNPPPPKSTIEKAASTTTTEVFRKEKLSTKEYFDRWDKFDVDKALAAIDDSDDEEEEVQPKKQTEIVVEPKVVETKIVAEPKLVVEKEPSPTKQFHRMAITEVDDAVDDDVVEEVFTPGATDLERSTQPSSPAPSKVVKNDKSSATTKDAQTSNTIPNDTTSTASDSSWQKISIVETSDSDEEELVDKPTASSSSMRRVDIVEETLTDNELDSEKFKSEGNTAMNEKRYSDAVRFYTLALDTNPDNTLALANRSAAYIKLEGMY